MLQKIIAVIHFYKDIEPDMLINLMCFKNIIQSVP